MKNSILVTAVLGAAFLISCGSQQNFSSRKYTKGKFRVASKRLKSDQPKVDHKDDLSFSQERISDDKELIQVIPREESEKFEKSTDELLPKDNLNPFLLEAATEEIEPETSTIELTRSKDRQQQPRSNLKDKKEKKAKKNLTVEQRQARKSLILGIIAVSLAVGLLTLAIISGTPSAYFFFQFLARSMRASVIPALFGVVYSLLAKFGNTDLGKYEKHRKVGFWLSMSTIILWVLFL